MDKLKTYTIKRLLNEYYNIFGYEPTAKREELIAALYFGKRAESLTQEEISIIYEF